MKIAFVSTILSFPWGGADTLWTHAAEAAARRGDTLLIAVSHLVRPHPRIQSLASTGATIVTRADPPGPARIHRRVIRRVAGKIRGDSLITALERFRPDLLIVSCGGTYDLVAEPELTAWLQRSRVPTRIIANYQVEHPALTPRQYDCVTHLFGDLDRLFFVSTRNLETTRRHLLMPLPNAAVLHNPLRCAAGDRLAWPEGNEYRLATVGRLDGGKGIALLLHALAAGLDEQVGWQLDIFGRGPDETLIHATIDALGLAPRVALRGYVSDLQEIWREHHLLASPSLEDGVPMTIPEAMLCGRPVLATAVGGAEDWITPGENGFLCPAANLPLLIEGLRQAWARRGDWPHLGANAARDAAARYRPNDYLALIAS